MFASGAPIVVLVFFACMRIIPKGGKKNNGDDRFHPSVILMAEEKENDALVLVPSE